MKVLAAVRFKHLRSLIYAEMMSLALDENLRRALASAQRACGIGELNKRALRVGHELLAETPAKRVLRFEGERASRGVEAKNTTRGRHRPHGSRFCPTIWCRGQYREECCHILSELRQIYATTDL
jgi:hypothetical protein